jgi:WD40 repeat protein
MRKKLVLLLCAIMTAFSLGGCSVFYIFLAGGVLALQETPDYDIDYEEINNIVNEFDNTAFVHFGHTSGTRYAAFSPDGKLAVSCSIRELKLWDVDTGLAIRTLYGHRNLVNKAVFSPDGSMIVSCSDDKTIRLWDVNTGKSVKIISSAHSKEIKDVVFSPDGQSLLSCSDDKTIKLIDIETSQVIKTFSGHSKKVNSAAFSPDGGKIVSGSDDRSVKIWDTASGRVIKTFSDKSGSGHKGYVNTVAFSPDGRHIASGGNDRKIKLWDIDKNKEILTIELIDEMFKGVNTVSFSPDGTRILSAFNVFIQVWDAATGERITHIPDPSPQGETLTNEINSAVFNGDGTKILSASHINKMSMWDASTGMLIKKFSGAAPTVSINSAAFSPDGSRIITGGSGGYGAAKGNVRIFSLVTGGQEQYLTTARPESPYLGSFVNSVDFSPDGSKIIAGGNAITVLFNANSGEEIRTFSQYVTINSILFSRDGKYFFSAAKNQASSVIMWDIETGERAKEFLGHKNSVLAIAVSRDGKYLASGEDLDCTVKLWDIDADQSITADEGKEIKSFIGFLTSKRTIQSLDFSPDGKSILVGAGQGGLEIIREVNPGEWEIKTLSIIDNMFISCAAFSPDGNQIFAGMGSEASVLIDVAEEKIIKTFSPNIGWINSVAFSPDGKRVMSGGRNGTVKLFDVATGREIVQFIGFSNGGWLAITPDGYYNASPGGDKYLTVRAGNRAYGIENYRSTYNRPDIVRSRLRGIFD